MKDTIRKCRQLLDGGDKGGFNNQKRKLPGFVFMSEIMPNTSPDKKGNPRPEDRWRVQEAARLNGLVMCDYDVKENPTAGSRDSRTWSATGDYSRPCGGQPLRQRAAHGWHHRAEE